SSDVCSSDLDLPIERPCLLGASRPADLGSAGEERRGLGVVLARRGRAVSVEEPLEVEADRDEGAERGEQRHGKDGCAGWRREAGPRAPSPWPCAPLAR